MPNLVDRFMNLVGYEKRRHWKAEIDESDEQTGLAGDQADPHYLDAYSVSVWVFRCVNLIAQQCAGIPLQFFNQKDEEVLKGDLIEVLQRVNPFDTSYTLKYQIAGFLAISGNAYLNYDKSVKEIYILRPDRMKVVSHPVDKIQGYLYEVNGKKIAFEPDEIVHFKTYNPYNEYYGLSALKVGMLPLTTDIWAARWNKNFFKNSAIPRGALISDQDIDEPTAKRLRKSWEKVYRGTDKAHRVAVFGKGAKWQDVMTSMKDMEFIQLRKMNREEIVAIFGVPPVFVGIFEFANYANSSQQIKIFWEQTIIPMLRLLESTYDEQLIPKIQKGLYSKHDLSGVEALKENELIKATTASKLVQSGIMSPNEVRDRYYDLPEAEWEGADEPPQRQAVGIGGLSLDQPKEIERITIPKGDKVMSEEDVRLWQLHEKKLTKQEGFFEGRMKEFFKAQERRVLKNFDALMKKTFTKMSEEEIEAVMSLVKEVEELRKNGATTISQILTGSAEAALLDLNIDISFQIKPQVEKWINAKALKLAGQVNDTTKLKIKKVLIEGIEEGQTVEDMRKGIQGVFEQANKLRARTIARTESNSAVSKGTLEGWKESEVVEKKTWLTAPGAENPRHELVDGLNGQTVGLNDSFNVQGEMLDHPGDPVGSPGNTINCRCAMIAKTRE